MNPEDIRSLRGPRSRALFARQVGVSPLTVYRWELPEDAKEARRPRGKELLALQHLSPSLPDKPRTLGAEDLELVWPLLHAALSPSWRRAEAELLALMATGRIESTDGQALAMTALAIVQVAHRAEPKAALAQLTPALANGRADLLSPTVEGWVQAVMALALTMDGRFFELGRVHAHAARALTLAGPGTSDVAALAGLALMSSAFLVGDGQLLQRAFAALDDVPTDGLSAAMRTMFLEVRAHKALFAGQPAQSTRLLDEEAAAAEVANMPLIQSRALALAAMRRLDDLVDPEEVLSMARRSQKIAVDARLGMGIHSVFAARAELEALMRLGRFAEAAPLLDFADRYLDEVGLPPLLFQQMQARYLFLTGRIDELRALGERLAQPALAVLRPICRAHAAQVLALVATAVAEDPTEILAAYDRAEEAAAGWQALLRDVLVFRVMALLVTGRVDEAELAVRRAQRVIDRFPSGWALAQLRRFEGVLHAARGRWAQARSFLEAAVATFVIAGDQPDAALTRHNLADCERAHGEPGWEARHAESVARLEELGIRLPRVFGHGLEQMRKAQPLATTPRASASLETLVVPVQRLALRGVSPALLLRELSSVLTERFGDRAWRIEEVDSMGRADALHGEPSGSEHEWFEFGDGAGRRLRMGVAAPLADDDRSTLQILAMVVGLSLEVASLHGLGEDAPATSPTIPTMAGFVAASPSMRKLQREIVRLSASRSTVIVTGESGSGKEVVARAIHDMSTRSKQPFVAFNCAAVPRELFEGQLFGYRRGAFTGATADHDGVFRAAHGGTLFLDEIGELPLDVQPKLLRALENGEILPLGERRPVHVDVRIIAATHRDLGRFVRDGRFREDLYYRLQVVPIRVPPLRERPEDVAALARHFVRMLAPQDRPAPLFSPDALALLSTAKWPGNVRELRNVIERALAYEPLPQVLSAAYLEPLLRPLA